MAICLIALGANLGDRQHTLNTAVDSLAQHPGLDVLAVSSWHGTRPIGGPAGQKEFLNGAALINTSLAPLALLEVLQNIETSLGRTRDQHWAARTLDLDLLLVDDQVIDEPDLQVPHPRMSFRRFVLTPAVEIAARMVHPVIGQTLGQLLDHLNHSAAYIALIGPAGVGKSSLALAVHERLGTRLLRDDENLLPENLLTAAETGPGLSSEIELLQRRVAQIEAALNQMRCAAPGALLISDFGLQQSLAYAKLRFPEEEFHQFLIVWKQILQRAPVPRLLISLDASPEKLLPQSRSMCEESFRASEALRAIIKDAITEHCQGPLLKLDATHPDLVLTETLAAIEAMQS